MLTAEYLRRQAETCLHIARACFDLSSAERLRLMATELKTKAAEIEADEKNQHGDTFSSHLMATHASSNGRIDRG